MTIAKIGFKIGEIEFSGEGEEIWVTKQLDRILEKVPELLSLSPVKPIADTNSKSNKTDSSEIAQKTLATFLKEKSATVNQVRKFLATSVWLHAKGNSRLETSSVTRALRESNQSRISNPADTLNQNVKKGFCEKEGKSFFVTEEGKAEILGNA
jgi:hypothetical protein